MNEISFLLWGEQHDERLGRSSFSKLIQSYQENGYIMNSPITMDKNMSLVNGTHRVGLNLYFGYPEIKARILRREIRHKRDLNWYVEHGLNKTYVSLLQDLRLQAINKLMANGNVFVLVTDKLNSQNQQALSDLISQITEHFQFKNFRCDNGDKLMCLFTINSPAYKIVGDHIESQTAKHLYCNLRDTNIPIIESSYNCSVGLGIFNRYKKYFTSE
jgi:hypothetical protein